MSELNISRKLLKISVSLYCISLFLPVFWSSNEFGLYALFVGWMGLLAGELNIGMAWLANPLYVLGLLFFQKRPKLQLAILVLALSCGLFAIGIKEIPIDEGGNHQKVSVAQT